MTDTNPASDNPPQDRPAPGVFIEPRAPFSHRAMAHAAKVAAPRLASLNSSTPRRPVFLIGCARSGTTLLERLLAMHRDVADWSEANEIWDPAWFPWRESSAVRPPVEYDRVAHTEAWAEANLPRMDQIQSIFGTFQTLVRGDVFLNKTPYHSFRIPYLREYFPEAKLIYIRRDGRAVVNSYMTKLFRDNKMREWPQREQELFAEHPEEFAKLLARYWVDTCREAENQNAELGLTDSGVMQMLTYEDVCADTAGSLRAVVEFIGLDPDRFHGAVWDQTISNTNYKWRDNLSEASQQAIIDTIGSELTEYGYV